MPNSNQTLLLSRRVCNKSLLFPFLHRWTDKLKGQFSQFEILIIFTLCRNKIKRTGEKIYDMIPQGSRLFTHNTRHKCY